MVAICNGGVIVGNAIGLGGTGPMVEATQSVFRVHESEIEPYLTLDLAHSTYNLHQMAHRLLGSRRFDSDSVRFVITAFGVRGRAVALSQADKRIDWLGAILFTGGFVMLFFSISQARAARKGWATDCKGVLYLAVLMT